MDITLEMTLKQSITFNKGKTHLPTSKQVVLVRLSQAKKYEYMLCKEEWKRHTECKPWDNPSYSIAISSTLLLQVMYSLIFFGFSKLMLFSLALLVSVLHQLLIIVFRYVTYNFVSHELESNVWPCWHMCRPSLDSCQLVIVNVLGAFHSLQHNNPFPHIGNQAWKITANCGTQHGQPLATTSLYNHDN